jgi:uncharacterized protein (TIGR02611 family)
VGLVHWLREQREKFILGDAYGYLEPDEDVEDWVRARSSEGKEGFVFITPRRVIVHWTAGEDGNHSFTWDEVHAWGISAGSAGGGGAALAVETSAAAIIVHMPVPSSGRVSEVSAFIRRFERHAPKSHRVPQVAASGPGTWETHSGVRVVRSKMGVSDLTKRIIVTLLGLFVLIAGLIMMVTPGPGLLGIIGGLALLSNEYDWAKDGLRWARKRYGEAKDEVNRRRQRSRTDG